MRLLSTILIASLAAALLPFGWAAGTASERIPPCHQHGKPTPAPGPVSHQCCQNAHNPAMVKTLHTGPRLDITTWIQNPSETLTSTSRHVSRWALLQTNHPPQLTPLRL